MMSDILWEPDAARVARSHMQRFMASVPGAPESYQALWEWSVRDLAGFWGQVWDFCGVRASTRYERILGDRDMPGADWFPGARMNFADNLLSRRDDAAALIGTGEGREDETVSWSELARRVACLQHHLRALGVGAGDRVAGLVPNCVEAVVAMLATTATGAVWSSCSPDFGAQGILDRFGQIQPKVLVTADGYRYNGKRHGLQDTVTAVCARIAPLEHVVVIEFTGGSLSLPHTPTHRFSSLTEGEASEPDFAQLPADHPLYIMYSSGTTGVPKSIIHGAGGTLMKHLSEHQLHTDLHPGNVLFWFTTCGWMMWNWLVGALAGETTVVLYDGSPTADGMETLWEMAQRLGVTHFGTSPRFLAANAAAGVRPGDIADLSRLQAVLSTGAPLNPEQFDWVYDNVAGDIQLASISGGTDIIGCFAAGVPILPVRRGELQARCLGMAVQAWDADRKPVVGEKGELVCTEPFPSMPVGFWNDPDGSRYRSAYFTENPGVWTHGDFIEIRPEGGVVIHGRSDTTLNPGGVRIGTAEIYRAVETLPEIADAIVVGRPVRGDVEIVLCVRPAEGVAFDDELVARIRDHIRAQTTPRHVPAHIFAVTDVPYTLSGKKVEKAVQATIAGEAVPNRDALANPESLDEYAQLPF